jgi:hypothetical protein
MSVQISNTELNDSFNTWRLNTNFAATVMSNNVVTVNPHGDANRGGFARGNGHVYGTFSANFLRTPNLSGGNTFATGDLTISSNVAITGESARVFTVSANSSFSGNVNFDTITGSNRLIMPDVSRVRITGGSRGQFLRIATETDTPEFHSLTLRDITNLSTNSAHIILSGANSTFSDNGDSTHLIFGSGADRAHVYLAKDSTTGDSDLYINLVDADGDSALVIADSSNTAVASIDSNGNVLASGTMGVQGATLLGSTLGVQGATTLGSTLGVADNTTIGGTLGVQGATNIKDSLGVQGNVSTAGNATVAGTLGVQGAANIKGALGVQGNVTTAGNITGAGTLGVQGNATLGGSATIAGTLGVQGATLLGSTLGVQGDTAIGGSTTVAGTLGVQGATNVKGALGVQGNVSTAGNATVAGTLGVQGATTINGAASVKGNLGVQGNITGAGTLGVQGATLLGSTLGVQGNTTVGGNATVAGTLGVQGATTINGAASVKGNLGVQGSGSVVGGLGVQGGSTIKGGLGVQGAATFNSTVGVQGNLSTNGNANVKGNFGVQGAATVLGGATVRSGVTANGAMSLGTDRTALSQPVRVAMFNNGGLDTLTVFANTTFRDDVFFSGNVVVSGAITQTGNGVFSTINVIGQSNLNGGVKLGSSSTDSINVQGNFISDLIAKSGQAVDLGSTTNPWDTIYANTGITFRSNETGTPSVSNDVDLTVERGTGQNAIFRWDEGVDTWQLRGATGTFSNVFTSNTTTISGLPEITSGILGTDFIMVYDASDSTILKKATISNAALQGPQGFQGVQGAQGRQGVVGAQGAQGRQGVVGAQGPQGVQGTIGAQGVVGAQGAVGAQGNQGRQGVVGAQGNQGRQGVQGALGPQGPQGVQGTVGAQGPQGRQGVVGAQGNQGRQGVQGATGPQGPQGVQGTNGINGAQGVQGAQGRQGSTGPQGFQGRQGAQGALGPQGAQGVAGGFTTNSDAQVNSLGVGVAASGVQGEIRATGDIIAGFSDARLKEFEGRIDNAVGKIRQIGGYYFYGNERAKELGFDAEKRQVGVNAQEIQQVLPEVVAPAPINDNYDPPLDYLTVHYDKLTALLIEAIRELADEIDELKKNK